MKTDHLTRRALMGAAASATIPLAVSRRAIAAGAGPEPVTTPAARGMRREDYYAMLERLRRTVVDRPTPRDIAAASKLVREGIVISCADAPGGPAATGPVIAGSPNPYRLQQWFESGDIWSSVNDRFEVDIHGVTSMTHLDTPAHFFLRQAGFAGAAQPDLRMEPLTTEALRPFVEGMVGRGVLLDFPGLLGRPMHPGEAVTPTGITRALERQRVDVRRGDLLFLRYGRARKLTSNPADLAGGLPGLSIYCADWIAARSPSVVVTDYGFDAVPTNVPDTPAGHMMMLVGLGIPLVDAATLERLAGVCARLGRWEFFTTIAPLDIPHASGSPVNPLAMF